MIKKFFITIYLLSTTLSLSVFAQPNYTLSVDKQNYTNVYSNYMTEFWSGFSKIISTENNYQGKNSNLRRITTLNLIGYDPYIIEIDSVKYVLVKDNNDNIFDENDILGISDTVSNIFNSLRPLDKNKDNKLTGEELSAANIRLVKTDKNGKLLFKDTKSDFDNSKIVFIHLKELRKAYKNNGSTGDFGFFDVLIKDSNNNNKLVTGIVKFETKEELKKYF